MNRPSIDRPSCPPRWPAQRSASLRIVAFVALASGALLFGAVCRGGAADARSGSGAGAGDSSGTTAGASPFGTPTVLTYAKEYPVIGYAHRPVDNRVARLAEQIDRGRVKLSFAPPRGYLDSLLKALDISPTSQVLVYSKTSLQTGRITAATPRAIYFNADTYVGWVQGAHEDIEIATMDSKLGQVFYSLPNDAGARVALERKTLDCLACHDTYELSGGGVPRFLLMSTYVDILGHPLTHEGQIITDQATPLKYRWGGWYVTGESGNQVHLGNIQVKTVYQLEHLDKVRRGNLETLKGLFDTTPYLSDKSDIVALLVLQHQVDVQNLITRVDFEVREALARARHGRRSGAADLSEQTQESLKGYMDSLAKAMLLAGATHFTSPISGNSGFTAWFQAQPVPRDPQGRALRDLDLKTRLFEYPMSFLIYSPGFAHLPQYAKSYLYGQFAAVLTGQDFDNIDPGITPAERTAALEILKATKPDFARFLARRSQASTITSGGSPARAVPRSIAGVE
ncbi:MAG: hypothetical protein ACRETB_05165 [Steroidobacteraceae bacterium]